MEAAVAVLKLYHLMETAIATVTMAGATTVMVIPRLFQ